MAFDLTREETHASALAGIEAVFLIARPGDEQADRYAVPLIDEMKRQGVRRVVNLTAMGVEPEASPHLHRRSGSDPRWGVRRIAGAAREHWGVENGCHWVLDVQMGEDACAVHVENAAQNLATLRRLVLMLLRREDTLKRGVAARQAKAARNVEYLELVLTRGFH